MSGLRIVILALLLPASGLVFAQTGASSAAAARNKPQVRMTAEDVIRLVRAGISSIMTLTVDPLPIGFTRDLDVVIGHVPMEDHQPPSIDSMDRAVEFIEGQVAAGKTVLVHCLAGEG